MSLNKNTKSAVWNSTKEEFQKLVDSSNSISDLIRKIGLGVFSGNFITVQNRIEKENICMKQFQLNNAGFMIECRRKKKTSIGLSDEDIFIENGLPNNRQSIKKRLISLGWNYECEICKIAKWQDKFISLHLDHKNGVNTDNRLENLRFLCPNCHSQTDTYSGKKLKKIGGKKDICEILPGNDELQKLLITYTRKELADRFGVSGLAIQMHAGKNGLIFPHTNYWESLRKGLITQEEHENNKIVLCFRAKRQRKVKGGSEKTEKETRVRRTKIDWPSDEWFAKEFWERPTSEISKELGVCDQAISNHLRGKSISKPPRGYWTKLKAGKL